MLPTDISLLLHTTRPDVATWAALCRHLDVTTLSPQQLGEVKKALSSWPREVPRPNSCKWLEPRYLDLCLHVTETESLYNYYIGVVSTSPRLRLRDGSPAVTMWRQLRGRVQLQNGTSIALGDGQPGLADLGGIMTIEFDTLCLSCKAKPKQFHSCIRDNVDYRPQRLSIYVEIEVKLDGKIPPQALEYRGTSVRQLTPTEQDQVQRQQAQLDRGGCYIFADRVLEAIEGLASFRTSLVERINV